MTVLRAVSLPLSDPPCQTPQRTSRRSRPTSAGLRPACPVAATGGSGLSLLVAPTISLVVGGQSRWPCENTLQLPPPLGCWGLGAGGWGFRTPDPGLRTAVTIPLLADTAPPRRHAPQFFPLPPVPRPPRLVPFLSDPLFHMLRPVG